MLVKLIKFASAAHWECYNSAVLLLTVQKEAKSKLLRFLYQNLNVNVVIIHSVMLKCLTSSLENFDSKSKFPLHVPHRKRVKKWENLGWNNSLGWQKCKRMGRNKRT